MDALYPKSFLALPGPPLNEELKEKAVDRSLETGEVLLANRTPNHILPERAQGGFRGTLSAKRTR